VDLTVEAGQHIVLFGPSGSGKSTLLRMINLLEAPDAGTLTAFGSTLEFPFRRGKVPVRQALALRRNVGMVFQQFNLFPNLSALHNVALPLVRVAGVKRREAEERAAVALETVGLRPWCGNYPNELSGGQQQRVAIARALITEPKLMLFDEPTSALDVEMIGEVLAVVRELATAGMTMVIVTHELGFARDIGDVHIFMEDGIVLVAGSRSLYDNPQNDRTRRFLEAVI
jgi:ABC-type polar amino acid transport system ATPase subunit